MIDTDFGANMIERTPVDSPYQKVRELTKAERKEINEIRAKLREEKDTSFRFQLAAVLNLDAKREVKHSLLRDSK